MSLTRGGGVRAARPAVADCPGCPKVQKQESYVSIDKPEVDFPGGEPPADLEIKDIWEGDGPVAKAA